MVNKDLQESCWTVPQKLTAQGYVRVKVKGKLVYLHRLTYETFIGKIPDGLVIDHLCKERSCCNFNHLEVVTLAENTRKGDAWLFNKSKTHCPQNHQYSEDNTYYRKDGKRHCKTCRRIRQREFMQNKRLTLS